MSWKATDVTNDSKDSQIEFDVMVGDTLTQTVVINSRGIDLPTSGDGYSIEGSSVLTGSTLGSGVTSSSLTTVGTIGTGTWEGTAIGSGYGGTGEDFSGSTGIIKVSSGTFSASSTIDLTSEVTGTLPVGNGGTGASTLASNAILTGNGTSAITAETNLSFNGSTLGVTGDVSISGSIEDSNNNEVITITATSSAVNEFTIANSATGNNPSISATGDDTNIGIDFQSKGTGTYNFLSTSTASTGLVFYEDTDNGSNTITLKAPSAITSSITLTLPDGDGDANQVLKTDGSGNLSWVAQSGGVSLTNDTNNYITTATGSNSVNGEANLTFDGSTLGVTGDINIVDSSGVGLTVQNSSDASSNQVAIFQSGNRSTPADNDEGYVSFYNDDSTGTQVEFSRMSWKATDVTNDSKDSQIEFDVMVGDTLTQTVVINSGGINLPTSGDGYSIEGTSVLTASTLEVVLRHLLYNCWNT